jgi:LysM repeat protein
MPLYSVYPVSRYQDWNALTADIVNVETVLSLKKKIQPHVEGREDDNTNRPTQVINSIQFNPLFQTQHYYNYIK